MTRDVMPVCISMTAVRVGAGCRGARNSGLVIRPLTVVPGINVSR